MKTKVKRGYAHGWRYEPPPSASHLDGGRDSPCSLVHALLLLVPDLRYTVYSVSRDLDSLFYLPRAVERGTETEVVHGASERG